MLIKIAQCLIWTVILIPYFSYGYRENSKFLGNDLTEGERHFGKRKRPGYQGNQGSSPCNFGSGRPKSEGSGKTFFDLQYYSIEYNNNLNIDCGQGGHIPQYPVQPAPVNEIHHGDAFSQAQAGVGHKPLGGIGHRPHPRPPKPQKPGNGGLFGGNGGNGFFGGFFGGGNNKPNKPHKPFHGGAFSQSASEAGEGGNTGSYSGPFAGILPSPQQFALGLSDGIQSFIGSIPAIGQSFISILPSFSDFQLPQLPQFNPGANTGPVTFAPLFQGSGSSSSFVNNVNRPPPISNPASTYPSIATTTPFTTTTIDPDDIIYSDEIKPVNEDFDPITDPYSSNGHLAPSQYLVISNPHLGSYTHQIGAFNPTNFYNKWQQGIRDVVQEFGDHRRYNQRGRPLYGVTPQYYNTRSQPSTYQNSQQNSYRSLEQGRSFSFPS